MLLGGVGRGEVGGMKGVVLMCRVILLRIVSVRTKSGSQASPSLGSDLEQVGIRLNYANFKVNNKLENPVIQTQSLFLQI